jgi:hypothetical protein
MSQEWKPSKSNLTKTTEIVRARYNCREKERIVWLGPNKGRYVEVKDPKTNKLKFVPLSRLPA